MRAYSRAVAVLEHLDSYVEAEFVIAGYEIRQWMESTSNSSSSSMILKHRPVLRGTVDGRDEVLLMREGEMGLGYGLLTASQMAAATSEAMLQQLFEDIDTIPVFYAPEMPAIVENIRVLQHPGPSPEAAANMRQQSTEGLWLMVFGCLFLVVSLGAALGSLAIMVRSRSRTLDPG